jgi:hypothetical protein
MKMGRGESATGGTNRLIWKLYDRGAPKGAESVISQTLEPESG